MLNDPNKIAVITCCQCKHPFAYALRNRSKPWQRTYCDNCNHKNKKQAEQDHYVFKRKPARQAARKDGK